MDEQTTRAITAVPFLSTIPLFGALFRNPVDFKSHEEVVVLVTPHIIRMRDPDSSRFPKPNYPETIDLAREKGEIPIIKPVRYDPGAVDLRPEAKDMKESEAASSEPAPSPETVPSPEPAPLKPHVIGAMQTLQPPSEAPARRSTTRPFPPPT